MKKYIKYCILGWMFVLLGFVNVTFAQTADLTTHHPIATPPSGAAFEWHNALPISASNWVASPTAVISGLYYGVYNFGTCYSEAAPICVATNTCPVATVDLNIFVETTGTPSGMTLTFHNASPVSDSNRLSGSAITAAASGTYYVAYRDNIIGCYSKESVIVVVNSSCLAAIVAVADTLSVLPGTNAPSVIINDTVNGVQAVIGTASGEVTLSSTPNTNSPLTMNPDGTITVASNTAVGTYPITYTICEVSIPTSCSTVTSTVTVTALAIAAANDSYNLDCASNSTLGNVLTNDKIDNKSITSSEVIITLESGANANITLNTTTGDLSITNSLAYGIYTLGYKICQATNTTNCSSGTITISLVQATEPGKVNCSDTYTFTNCVWVKDNNTPTIR
jgi:hypothetical protein